MSQYYLAVDIGASSGRHMLARIQDGKIELEEIYRFENGMKRVEGKLLWLNLVKKWLLMELWLKEVLL